LKERFLERTAYPEKLHHTISTIILLLFFEFVKLLEPKMFIIIIPARDWTLCNLILFFSTTTKKMEK
jgi:hypothetical protein